MQEKRLFGSLPFASDFNHQMLWGWEDPLINDFNIFWEGVVGDKTTMLLISKVGYDKINDILYKLHTSSK